MTRSFPPEKRCPKPEAWPATDRAAWRIACQPSDPFDPNVGRANLLRASTRRQYENDYGRWLTWLKLRGELDVEQAPGDRATDERVRAFYGSLKADGLAPYTIAERLMGLSCVLRAMDPDGAYNWIALAARRIRAEARPVKDIEKRLRPVEEVVELAYALMWEAEYGRFRTAYDRATLFRDGLIIALLVYCPLRIANLAGIVIGEHLHRRGETWWLAFGAGEMKNNRPYECPWPGELALALDRYLESYRPTLIGDSDKTRQPPRTLWISKGAPTSRKNHISHLVRKRTAEEFGTPITPHNFRHLAATTIATDDPDGVTAIAAVLAHSTVKTSEAHYNKAKQIDAAARYQASVEARRPRRRSRREPHEQLMALFGNEGRLQDSELGSRVQDD